MQRANTIFLFILLFFSATTWGARYELFREGIPNASYEGIVPSLNPGDILTFSDGNEFTIEKLLGRGNTTLIFELKGINKALRLPLTRQDTSYIKDFVVGYRDLAAMNASINVYLEYRKDANYYEYAVVEKLTAFMPFTSFVTYMSSSETKRAAVQSHHRNRIIPEEMIQQFYVFAKKISLYSHIGDMHEENLVYDFTRKAWRLIDWTEDHEKSYSTKAGEIIFSYDTSPLQSLIKNYGTCTSFSFIAKSPRHLWLENMILEAHNIIAESRFQTLQIGFCEQIL
ncbi:MAG: hypothetical protein AAGB31_13005 [Bdellovibrio sp.]